MEIQASLSFSLDEYQRRVAGVRQLMAEQGIDALLVHQFPNICYLSGYESLDTYSYTALFMPLEGEPVLVTWYLEFANTQLTSWVRNVITYPLYGDPLAPVVSVLNDYNMNGRQIGLELASTELSVQSYQRIVDVFPQATFVDCSDLVQRIRAIKSSEEIEHLRRAASITDLGMQAAVARTLVGCSDYEIAAAAYQALIAGGSEQMSIQPIVSAGTQSGIGHRPHRGITVQRGDTILLELGACFRRYTAPIMRSVVLGEPNETVTRMVNASLTTLNDVIAAMVPGKSFHDVATVGKVAIAKAGPDAIWHEHYAYSVGLSFPPSWNDCPVKIVEGNNTILQPGMVFHLPISLRNLGRYGIAFSETVAITETGNEVLTHLDRRLFQH